MDKKPWIKAFGTAEETALIPAGFSTDGCLVLAFFTDSFKADYAEKILPISTDQAQKLLELRVFDAEQELWLHRTTIGDPFHWRIASEDFENNKKYIIRTKQLLDLGESESQAPMYEDGLRVLHTTSGYAYKLPIGADDKYVDIINYLSYDENGVANALDYRYEGFSKEGQ